MGRNGFFFTNTHERGRLLSMEFPEEKGWLIYEFELGFSNGRIKMMTSKKECEMNVSGSRVIGYAEIYIDGRELGTMKRSGDKVDLLESTGSTFGTYFRFVDFVKSDQKFYEFTEYNDYATVEFVGRSDFRMCRYVISEKIFKGKEKRPERRSLLKDLSWQPTELEEDWLLAMTGWEIIESVRNNYGSPVIHH